MTTEEPHRISCPYEPIGFGVAMVQRTAAGEVKIDMATPIRCMTCHRYFKIGTRVQLVGKPIDGE